MHFIRETCTTLHLSKLFTYFSIKILEVHKNFTLNYITLNLDPNLFCQIFFSKNGMIAITNSIPQFSWHPQSKQKLQHSSHIIHDTLSILIQYFNLVFHLVNCQLTLIKPNNKLIIFTFKLIDCFFSFFQKTLKGI